MGGESHLLTVSLYQYCKAHALPSARSLGRVLVHRIPGSGLEKPRERRCLVDALQQHSELLCLSVYNDEATYVFQCFILWWYFGDDIGFNLTGNFF